MPVKKGRTIISASTNVEILQEIDAIAENDGLTRSVVINELIIMAIAARKAAMRPKLSDRPTVTNTEINS